jgi:hypothetical protein
MRSSSTRGARLSLPADQTVPSCWSSTAPSAARASRRANLTACGISVAIVPSTPTAYSVVGESTAATTSSGTSSASTRERSRWKQ